MPFKDLTPFVTFKDLQYLSEGLEGRSRNPVALLFDTLMLPNTDIGGICPSSLNWKRNEAMSIPHLVLGAGPPGGSWNQMSKHIRSLSPARWLELPGYDISTWYREQVERPSVGQPCSGPMPLGDIAQYYGDYVKKMKLSDNIMNHITVTAVEPMVPLNRSSSDGSCDSSLSDSDTDSPLSDFDTIFRDVCNYCESSFAVDRMVTRSFLSGERHDSRNSSHCPPHENAIQRQNGYRWHIRAKNTDRGGDVIDLYCKKLVLACGVGSTPRWLGVPGEALPYVSHTFSDVCTKILSLPSSSAVLIVGAGLTAADAINLALERQLHVVHVYQQDVSSPSLIYGKLSSTTYKHYTDLFQLMKGKVTNHLYTSLARSSVKEFREDGTCVIIDKAKQQRSVAIKAVGILIGSEADLSFLPPEILAELSFDAAQPVSAKLNPVSVHPYTFECTRVPDLYAVGSLVGDTLVRFILGGALGVTQALHMQKLAVM